jgi:DNA invertase Pin-like site-specific DNA recombinase
MLPMKAALYARVSTIDKDQNPETQLLRLRDYANARGMEISPEHVFVDFRSGKTTQRPQLQRMMKAIHQRQFDYVIIVRLDRIMRSTRNLLNLLEEMKAVGVELVCLDQSIDTSTPAGNLLITVLGAIAQFEAEVNRDRVLDGLARAKAEGKTLGRPKGAQDKRKRRARRLRSW